MDHDGPTSGVSLTGLRAVVSAGAAGIGRSIVEALAGAGARVAAFDVSEDAVSALRSAHPEVLARAVDVSNRSGVDAFIEEVATEFGGLDVLVNNAGIAGPTAKVEDVDPTEWEATIAINLTGQFYCARKAAPSLRTSGSGAIINIASVAGRAGLRKPHAVCGVQVGRCRVHQEPCHRNGPGWGSRERDSPWRR